MEFRTIDGSGNNLAETEMNTPGTAFARIGPARFADGVSALVDGPNPRTVSNVVVGEGEAAVANTQGLSGMLYAWPDLNSALRKIASDQEIIAAYRAVCTTLSRNG